MKKKGNDLDASKLSPGFAPANKSNDIRMRKKKKKKGEIETEMKETNM